MDEKGRSGGWPICLLLQSGPVHPLWVAPETESFLADTLSHLTDNSGRTGGVRKEVRRAAAESAAD